MTPTPDFAAPFDQRALEALDNYLLRGSRRPIAVGLSGGGDSLALTLIADAWAREAGRELSILTVDHGLQPESAAWTQLCAATAQQLGRPFRALPWL
ncbi:MAG TPA: ATP-binding protein, partial [Phenylobacterium sp.]|nr:ATP-binding protein [Phenylobacterium sp.]